MTGAKMGINEKYFSEYRKNIIGSDLKHPFPSGEKPILYADWAASGRLYRPIEEYLVNTLGPYVANTHTETTLTGTVMTDAYHQAHAIIKRHVNAGPDDRLLFAGFGMTAVVNKFQRILGLHLPEQFKDRCWPSGKDRPLVIITHMEHHSNQTSWVECLADVMIIRGGSDGLPDQNHLRELLQQNTDRKMVIGSFTACSNVTGIITPYHELAALMHEFGRYCFIDFSASAPYVDIDMHPADEMQSLDAIFFSPHKFLGGPGSSGVIVFNKKLYSNKVPDHPGGGTVTWTNPWGDHHYFDDIEIREDGGTPGFLQGIKASMAVLLKEKIGTSAMAQREHVLKDLLMDGLQELPGLTMLEADKRDRVAFISFYVKNVHHNLIVRLLNDRFGIQTRGGCSCAGTYGHVLLNIDFHESKRITSMIDTGNLSEKPGWVRISLHPVMTDGEVRYILDAMKEILANHQQWQNNYRFDSLSGDYLPVRDDEFRIDLTRAVGIF
jgi:selenocysteine lyase/cysteine desulfurase